MPRLRPAFYPTSGGQPFDTGTLGGARVIDVIDHEDGTIVHVVSGASAAGDVVERDHRLGAALRAHAAAHGPARAVGGLRPPRAASAPRASTWGLESATIDLAREVTPREIAQAEDEANRIVWEDRPVAVRFATAEEAAALPLRKEPARTGPLRLIDVEGFDLSACGGTHVARTGGIGIIAVTGWEKFRGGHARGVPVRRPRAGGGSAWRDALAATLKHLSVAPEELAAGVERLQDEGKALQRALRGMQEKLAVHEAQALVARGRRVGDRLVIVEAMDGWDAQGLKAMAAAAAAAEPGGRDGAVHRVDAGAGGGRPRPSRRHRCRRGAEGAGRREFGGKGGGKPDLAQGGGLDASSATLVAAARKPAGRT